MKISYSEHVMLVSHLSALHAQCLNQVTDENRMFSCFQIGGKTNTLLKIMLKAIHKAHFLKTTEF